MKLSAPKNITFWVAVILAVLGLIGALVPTLPWSGVISFWLAFVGFVVLALGNILPNL
jgi:hypothetical protein